MPTLLFQSDIVLGRNNISCSLLCNRYSECLAVEVFGSSVWWRQVYVGDVPVHFWLV